VRVVAGEFGGRRLAAPPGGGTRPTADRVREALFSMLGDVSGLRVLDLFAGSGALGIEALSRGAEAAVFVERNRKAAAVVRKNLDSLRLRAPVVEGDALTVIGQRQDPYDLVFVDPPYDSAPLLAGQLAERLPGVLSENARIVTESDKRRPLELPFPLLRERTYSDVRIAIHGR
jgi:16S rRNA (guanine966-N2)-methyltransferase